MKIYNNWECSVKFKCSTVVVKILKNTCAKSKRPINHPESTVQSPSVQASKRPEKSKRPGVQSPSVQSPSVQSPSAQSSSAQGSRVRVQVSRFQASRPCVQSPAFPVCLYMTLIIGLM